MKLTVPTEFKLAGHTYTVELKKNVLVTDGEYGSLNEITHVMQLQPPNPVPVSRVECTFLHELLHAIFFELGEAELDKNERLINSISGLLHQALTTSHGDVLKGKP